MNKIGNKLRGIRNELHIKQENMADLLGISQTKYSRIERNEYEVKPDEAKIYAEKLGIPEDALKDDLNQCNVINNNNNKIENQTQSHQIDTQNYNFSISPELKKLYERNYALMEELKDEKIKSLEEKNKALEERIRRLEKL